ncbi:hypothetical protein Q5H92_22760 [Hymenobacter sp. M29]|uniref:Uncharacterized protein n=1 Tax=Hymenobacter mellowenesis TaxID=3063995 RepID=A0ABT9AH48_9BACT|nr:hypothetical protein [Hymenobacter sp. M29]MDO7849203.1 hypothetical protein [Hymenobacter sp. M29]
MIDIVSLISELGDQHVRLTEAWPSLSQQERQTGKAKFEEVEQTILSKLLEVKYFQSLGDSFIKVSKPEDGRPMYLEIVTVFEGSQGTGAFDFPAEFEFQLQPLTGWLPMFRSCQPATEAAYQVAVERAIEKGAVVVE